MQIRVLTIRQPWCELILRGEKTREHRTWLTLHRGLLGIHSAVTVDKAACEKYGLDPDELPTRALLGVVDLTGVVKRGDQYLILRCQSFYQGVRFSIFKPGFDSR